MSDFHPPPTDSVVVYHYIPLKKQILPLASDDDCITVAGPTEFESRCRSIVLDTVNGEDSPVLPNNSLRHHLPGLVEEGVDFYIDALFVRDGAGPAGRPFFLSSIHL